MYIALARRDWKSGHAGRLFPSFAFLADCKTGLGDDDGSPFRQRTFRRYHSFLFTRQMSRETHPAKWFVKMRG